MSVGCHAQQTGLWFCSAVEFLGIPRLPAFREETSLRAVRFQRSARAAAHQRPPPSAARAPLQPPTASAFLLRPAWPPCFWEMLDTLPPRISLRPEPSFQACHSSLPHPLQVSALGPPKQGCFLRTTSARVEPSPLVYAWRSGAGPPAPGCLRSRPHTPWKGGARTGCLCLDYLISKTGVTAVQALKGQDRLTDPGPQEAHQTLLPRVTC